MKITDLERTCRLSGMDSWPPGTRPARSWGKAVRRAVHSQTSLSCSHFQEIALICC